MKLAFLTALLLVSVAALSDETPQIDTGGSYAVASRLKEFLGEPSGRSQLATQPPTVFFKRMGAIRR